MLYTSCSHSAKCSIDDWTVLYGTDGQKPETGKATHSNKAATNRQTPGIIKDETANLRCASNPQAYATDVCVPLSRLPQIIVETKQDLLENRITGEYNQPVPTGCRTNRKPCYAYCIFNLLFTIIYTEFKMFFEKSSSVSN